MTYAPETGAVKAKIHYISFPVTSWQLPRLRGSCGETASLPVTETAAGGALPEAGGRWGQVKKKKKFYFA